MTYPGLVQFALSLTDSLLFVHYLALILIELRHWRSQYYVKVSNSVHATSDTTFERYLNGDKHLLGNQVVRNPDGESRGFALGAMSVQMAAASVLDKYYTEFPVHNPYLDR